MANAIQNDLGFLYSTLNADATFTGYVSGIYQGLAPANSTPDYCMLIPQSSMSIKTAFGVKIMSDGLYQVKIVGPETDYANLYNAYNQMLTDLALVRPTSGSWGSILACYLEQDLYVQELVAGIPWINLGGLFRIEA